MHNSKILAEMLRTRSNIRDVKFPKEPGLYGIFITNPENIPEGLDFLKIESDKPVYIGKSTNLNNRRNFHFRNGRTGESTLRRSIGALLKDELKLVAIPGRKNRNDSDFKHHKFKDSGEKGLTAWMTENLEIGYCCIHEEELKNIEEKMIEEIRPVLNLQGWENPYSGMIMDARKRCADEARKNIDKEIKAVEGKDIAKKAISKLNKRITNEVFLIIQNDRELMHEYLRAVDKHGLDNVNRQIGKAVSEAYKLTNLDDREDDPSCTLIQSHQKFK